MPANVRVRPILLAALVALPLAACVGPAVAPPPPPAAFELTVLHVNDHHSRLDGESTVLKLSDAAGKARNVGVELGGFARVTAAMEALGRQAPNVLKLHAGDATTGDLYYTQSGGEADAALMNTVCFDALALGNHEFDNGDNGLVRFLDYLATGPCRTAVVSSNVRAAAGTPLAQRLRPHVVLERGGQRIGIIGVTVKSKTEKASRPDPTTSLEDEATAVRRSVEALKAQGVGKIVVLSHQGYRADLAMAAQVPEIDVIVGGDSHTLLGPESLRQVGLDPAGPYPTRATNRDGQPVCIVQAWQYAYAVGELKVRFNGDAVESCAGAPRLLIGESFKTPGEPLAEPDAKAFARRIAAEPALRPTVPSVAAAAALAPFKVRKEALGAQKAGAAAVDLCMRRVPGVRHDSSRSKLARCNTDATVVAHGGAIQQFVAQAHLDQARKFGGADLSLLNGGAVRSDVPAGDISVAAIYTLLPFKNTLVRLDLSGREIQATLEDALASVADPGGTGSGAYPYAAGLRWKVDMTRPRGSRIGQLEWKNPAGAWVAVVPEQRYRVVVIDYLANGGDNWLTLKGLDDNRRENTYLDYAEAFMDYLKAKSPITRPAPGDFSTQSYREPR